MNLNHGGSIVVQYTKNGEAHGLVEQYTNSVSFDDFKNINPKIKDQCIKQKKEDGRLVKVKYINTRGRTERLPKVYCKWAGEPIQKWNLIPGQVYDVPKGMIDEVNAIKRPKRSGLCTVDGTDLNPLGAPSEVDQIEDGEHLLVPATF